MNNELLVWTYDGRNVLDHEGGRIDAVDPSYINFDNYVPDGKMIHLIIQDGVREIPDRRFRHFRTLMKLTMADTIESIGSYTFEDCIELTEIKWSINLQYIRFNAFCGCRKLGKKFGPTNFLPGSLCVLDTNAFSSCGFSTVIISEFNHIYIAPDAFLNTKLWRDSTHSDESDFSYVYSGDDCYMPVDEYFNDWVFHHHLNNNYHLHYMFSRLYIEPDEIIETLSTEEEHLYSDIGDRLYKEKDQFGLTPMDYHRHNPYKYQEFDEMELMRRRILRLMKLDGLDK